MKETKKMKFTECLSHLFVFIKPYRFKLLFGILMVITAQVTFALNPTVEGMITTQLASDISSHQPIQIDLYCKDNITIFNGHLYDGCDSEDDV